MICCKTGPKTPKAAKDHCDKLFSYLIRSVGHCEHCGVQEPYVQLQCAHWISRRYSNTRCDPENAFCLCARDHRWFTDHPTEFGRWAIKQRGEDVYQRLLEASRETSKVDWFEQHDILQEMCAEVFA